MRVSMNENDPGHANWLAVGDRIEKILVDGVERFVVEADEELGYVVCYLKNEDGLHCTNPDGTVAMETVHGRVQIIMRRADA